MTKKVVYTSCTRLSCINITPSPSVILCLTDSALLAPVICPDSSSEVPYDFFTLEATLTKSWKNVDNCSNTSYSYVFSYDENLLSDPGTALIASQIAGVFCQGCLTDWVKEEVGSEISLTDNGAGTLTLTSQHGCTYEFASAFNVLPEYTVEDEDDLIAAIAGNFNMVVIGSVILTADRTIVTAVRVLHDGSFTTSGHILTINGPFTCGAIQAFITATSEVVFGANATVFVLPEWFGAVADGVTDSGPAINLALGILRVSGEILQFSAGTYSTTVSLNATGLSGIVIAGAGMSATTLYLRTSGTPGLDFTGSIRYVLRDILLLAGSSTTSCNVCILKARNNTGASVGLSKLVNVQIETPNSGTTCKATVYSYASEDDEYWACNLYTHVASTPALYITSKNDLSITSLYQTIVTGEQSNTTIHFVGGSILDTTAAQGVSSAYPVYLHNVRDFTLRDASLSASADAFIYLLSDGPAQLIDMLNILDNRFEQHTLQPLYCMYGDATNTSINIGEISGNIFNASAAIYKQAGTAATAIYAGTWGALNSNGTASATYLIDTGADVIGGLINASNYQIQTHKMYGTIVYNLKHQADLVFTGSGGVMVTAITNGLSEVTTKILGGWYELFGIGKVPTKQLDVLDLTINANSTIARFANSQQSTAVGSYTEIEISSSAGVVPNADVAGIRAEIDSATPGNRGTALVFQAGRTVAGKIERGRVSSNTDWILGIGAIATNATDGFTYIPSCAGTPTGVPTGVTGMIPLVVDSTNNKLYFYSGGTWRDAGP